MKITFIGTSHGVPAADRYCSCIMLEVDKSIYFIDAGAPVIDALLRLGRDISNFKAMFTTHVHGDHTLGMLPLAELMTWYYKQAEGDFFITDQAHIDSIRNIIITSGNPHFPADRVRLRLAAEGVVYEDENIKVEYIRTQHTDSSYAILVTEGKKRVLFGGDFAGNLTDVPEVIKEELDAFVCEMAHFGPDAIKPHLEICQAKRVFFSHVWPLEKYDQINAMKGAYPFEVFTPNDGDEFEI